LSEDETRDTSRDTSDEETARAVALLEATHQFPVVYSVSIIAVSSEEVGAAVRAAVEEGLPQPIADDGYQAVPSSGGKYASHRFKVPCQTPAEVLALYRRVRQVKGVVTVL
jgi:putative lipoic acid-binding regulatory protein